MTGAPQPVLLLVRELGIGGCERDLSRVARSLDRARFAPHVGCFHDQGFRAAEIREAGVPVVRFPVRSFKDRTFWQGFGQLREYIRRHRIALVHAYDAPMDIFAAPLRLLPGSPRVLLNHLWLRDCLRPHTTQRLLRLTDWLGDCFVTNSLAARQEMIHRFGRRPERVLLCYNGVDSSQFHPRGRARRPGLEAARLVIGSVCALRPEKRIDLLVEAFARLDPARRGLVLLIVGSGTELPALQEQVRRAGVADVCHFQPATERVPEWLRSIDVYVLPSESESFPNSLVEAMSCGCAVVASRVGGIPEMIRHGLDGLLVAPRDAAALASALDGLVAEPRRVEVIARGSLQASVRFSLNLNLARTSEIYEALLAGRLPSALPDPAPAV